MKRLRACPPMPVRPHEAADVPPYAVGHQDDPRGAVVTLLPQDDDAHLVLDVREAQGAGEVPLPPVALAHLLAHARVDLAGQFGRLEDAPSVLQLAVELE